MLRPSELIAAPASGRESQWTSRGMVDVSGGLNGGTGVISGTPTTAGTFTFTAQVNDEAGGTASRVFVITITGPGGPTATPTPTSPSTTPQSDVDADSPSGICRGSDFEFLGLLALTVLLAGLDAFALRRMS